MRRKDREVTDFKKMLEIMEGCDCCHLGLVDETGVYIVPLNFGYMTDESGKLTLYFHGAAKGKKIDLIKESPCVGFEMDRKHKLVENEAACEYSFLYQSIIGKGNIKPLEGYEEKAAGFAAIMKHYTGRDNWELPQKAVDATAVMKLTVEEWSCKEHQ